MFLSILKISGELFIFQQDSAQVHTARETMCFLACILRQMLTDSNISQRSVATGLRCGGIVNYHFSANLRPNKPVKEFLKSLRLDELAAMSFVVYFFGNSDFTEGGDLSSLA